MANSNGWGDGAANNTIGWGQGANNAIGWGSVYAVSNAGLTNIVGVTTDADAQAFITAAAITDATEQGALDVLVKGLKTDLLWTKMLAVYPFVGGTATSCKYNLKNPVNTNLGHRLNFVGGWTFSSNGITPNGTTAYADTFLSPLTHFTSGNSSLSAYSRINNLEAGTLLGTRGSAFNTNLELALRNSSNTTVFHNTSSGAITVSPNPTTSAINFISSRINSANNITAQNGATNSQVSSEIAFSNFSIYISAKNSIGVAATFSTRNLAFAHIGTGLTQAECTLFYNRIQTFQTTLGRQV